MSLMMVSSASPLLRMVSAKSRCSAFERGVQQQAAHADDGVHRGADLVAHLGQEGALGLGGGLGGLLGLAQGHPDPLLLLQQEIVLHENGGLAGDGLGQLRVMPTDVRSVEPAAPGTPPPRPPAER